MELTDKTISYLQEKSNEVRKHIVKMISNAGAGHPGGSLSATDIIVCLYFNILRIDPTNPKWDQRDRFILSKGHASPALYATLAERGFFSIDELLTFDHVNSKLQGHPDMTKTPGVDMSTGSLGQGLSVGVGMALGARYQNYDFLTYVLMGDGEIQEGQVWEAALAASHNKLDNLIAIIDVNKLQLVDRVEKVMPSNKNLVEKWSNFGWDVLEMDGHDISQILSTFQKTKSLKDKPKIIIAHTIKGKGVSYMENNVIYHSKGLSEKELALALDELSGNQEDKCGKI